MVAFLEQCQNSFQLERIFNVNRIYKKIVNDIKTDLFY